MLAKSNLRLFSVPIKREKNHKALWSIDLQLGTLSAMKFLKWGLFSSAPGVVAKNFGKLTSALNFVYIIILQSYDYGIGQGPGLESHGA